MFDPVDSFSVARTLSGNLGFSGGIIHFPASGRVNHVGHRTVFAASAASTSRDRWGTSLGRNIAAAASKTDEREQNSRSKKLTRKRDWDSGHTITPGEEYSVA